RPVRRTVPDSCPRLVGPAQTEGKVRLARGKHFVEWPLDDALASEPVVVIAERLDAVLPCELGLGDAGLRQTQVVEAEVRRDVRLVMAREHRLRPGGVGPLGKSLSPPFIVLRNGMILRKVEGNRPR